MDLFFFKWKMRVRGQDNLSRYVCINIGMIMYVHIFICYAYLHSPGGIWGCICCHLGDYNMTILGSPTASYTRWVESPKPIQESLQLVLLDLSLKSLRNLGCLIVCILFTQDKLVLDEWRLQHFLVAESRQTKRSKKLRVSYLDYWGCFIYTKRGKSWWWSPEISRWQMDSDGSVSPNFHLQLLVFEGHIFL